MTRLKITEEKERDASQQRCSDEREAAASAATNKALEAHEREREEEQDLVEAVWVANTQLQLSQLSTQDANGDQHHESSSSSDSSESASDNEDDAGPSCQFGSQGQPLRYHQVMSLADLDESNAQLELWSHRTGR
jgi:hypothetical protein